MESVDITKLRKVNELSRTLTKHGLAMNRLEAVKIAREINADEDEMGYLGELKVGASQQFEVSRNAHNVQDGQNIVVESHPDRKFMTKEQVENVLQEFCNLFSTEIDKLNAQINELQKRLESLKYTPLQKIQEDEMKIEKQSTLCEPENKPQQQPHISSRPVAASSPASISNPRCGNYQSDDVSIEKFFYYGTK